MRINKFCRSNSRGFTLIEIIVVIGILAMLVGLALSFFKSPSSILLKKESTHLVGTIKYAYNEAARKNVTYRIAFDLTNQHYWLEAGSEDLTVESDAQIEKKKKTNFGLKKDKKDSEGNSEDGSEGTSEAAEFTEDNSSLVIKKVKLDGGIKFRDIYVSHQETLATEGIVYLFFFSDGSTEEAVIHLSDENEENNYTLVTNPVTGKTKIIKGYLTLEEIKSGKTE